MSIKSIGEWWERKPQTFDSIFDPRHNAIGFMRTAFAVVVIFSHTFPLGGFGTEILERFSHGTFEMGTVAVFGFFTLSGFLITASFTHSPSVWRYLWNRFLRIMPAYWVALVVVAFGFAPLAYYISHGHLHGFLITNVGGPIDYIRRNFMLHIHQYSVSGLIGNIPWPGAFNGSLWTLYYEATGYLLVAAFGIFGVFKKHSKIVLGATLTLFGLYVINHAMPGVAANIASLFTDTWFLQLMLFFFAGSAWYLYGDKLPLSNKYFVLAAVLYVLSLRYGFYTLVGPVTFVYCVFYLAAKFPIRSFDRKVDLSYGIYIYAFPVQQTLSELHVQKLGILAYALISLCVTLPFAAASYYIVERPALKLKRLKFKLTLLQLGMTTRRYLVGE